MVIALAMPSPRTLAASLPMLWVVLLAFSRQGAEAQRSCSPSSLRELTVFLADSNCQSYALTALDLSGTTMKQATEVGAALARSKDLHTLSMPRTSPNMHVITMLTIAFKQGSGLKVLDFSHNGLDEDLCNALAEGMRHATGLRRLNLVNCNVDDDCAVLLALVLSEPAVEVTHLNLYHNRITSRGASFLSSYLASRNVIETLDVGMNPLGDAGVSAVSRVLDSCTSITSLSLSSVQATAHGAEVLARAVAGTRLRRLSFSKNYAVGPAGGEALGQHLKQARFLEYVDVSMCALGNRGAASVLDGLSESKNLQKLLLAVNDLDEQTVVAPFVATHPALEVLDLSHNHLDDAWCLELIDSLRVTACFFRISLRAVRLSQTAVTFQCLQQLQEVYAGLECDAASLPTVRAVVCSCVCVCCLFVWV